MRPGELYRLRSVTPHFLPLKTPMPHSNATARQRQLIAAAAARLMAEEGIGDASQAKRKAAHQLGLAENVKLPENADVEAELRLYQRLFQHDEQSIRLLRLRRTAREAMAELQRFSPYLSGAVADGTAGRHAEIDIQLFTDSAKDVEIFLLNKGIAFTHQTPRNDRAEAVLTIEDEEAPINLVIYPRNDERIAPRTRDGRPRPRLQLAALDRLLEEFPDDLPEPLP